MDDRFVVAWLFVAVAEASVHEPATVKDVIWAADYINRAVPSNEELVNGLNALMANGLIEQRGERFALTAAGQRVLKHSSGPGRFDQIEQLIALGIGSGDERGRGDWRPPAMELDAQRRAYSREFWKMTEEMSPDIALEVPGDEGQAGSD